MEGSRIRAAAAIASSAAFSLLAIAGLYQGMAVEGGLPGISLDYMPRIRALHSAGDLDGAIHELRAATLVDAGNPAVAGVLEELATQRGDVANRILALRAQIRAEPFDAAARARLSQAYLEEAAGGLPQRRVQRVLVRAVWQAEQAVRMEPDTAGGHLALARALLASGQEERGRAELEEARRLDPSLEVGVPTAARDADSP